MRGIQVRVLLELQTDFADVVVKVCKTRVRFTATPPSKQQRYMGSTGIDCLSVVIMEKSVVRITGNFTNKRSERYMSAAA